MTRTETTPKSQTSSSARTESAGCCTTAELAACCEPSAKGGCCGPQAEKSDRAPTSCGCR